MHPNDKTNQNQYDSLNKPASIKHIDNELFIIFNKRTGFRTHKVSDNQLGLVEVLSDKLKLNLYVVHRLDKETSGLILFAKTKESAALLAQKFEQHQIQKTYFFLTDRQSKFTEKTVSSHIEKNDKVYLNNPSKPHNSETHLTYIKSINNQIHLWKAEPVTGKPHQIRLHAELVGLPILGDTEHGGSDFFRLALHASQIEFEIAENKYNYKAELPYCFQSQMNSLGEFVRSEFYDLEHILDLQPDQTYRIYHRNNHVNDIRIDFYSGVIWVYWYKASTPTELDIQSLDQFCNEKKFKYVIRHMINRGQGVGGKEHQDLYFNDAPEKWIAKENQILVELRRDQGFSPGLFLDQRNNRQYILNQSKNKTVLNLFSYTSAFSVAAALGQAQIVTTVDASPNFLNWSKENFKLNQIEPITQDNGKPKYEFFAQDSLLFLQGSIKRKRQWDIIICDPPSFGRTKTTTWKIEKDLAQLIELMWKSLTVGGFILFTCNFEKWSLEDIKKVFNQTLKGQKFSFENLPIYDLDFEFPDAYDNLLKGLIVRKK